MQRVGPLSLCAQGVILRHPAVNRAWIRPNEGDRNSVCQDFSCRATGDYK